MRGEPSSPTLQQENVLLGALQSTGSGLECVQHVCLSGTASAAACRGGTVSLAAQPPDDDVFVSHFSERFKSFKSFKDKHTELKAAGRPLCAWSMHTACKDTPTHSYGVHLEQHPHLRQPKYDLSHITHHNQNAEPVHSSGQAAAGRPLASRAPRLLPPYLLLYAGSGGGGGGGGSSKIRGRDRLLAAPTLE